MKYKKTLLVFSIITIGLLFFFFANKLGIPLSEKIMSKKTNTDKISKTRRTVDDVIAIYGTSARQQLQPYFKQAKVAYPPRAITFLAMKQEQLLEVWAKGNDKKWHFINQYAIKQLSGHQGPKLREGDKQVPEGIYQLSGLNPNSSYHLSMKLNYPNAFDQQQADAEGRAEPGTNIFIHGKAVSIGCLAMGDKTIETLFVLANDVGVENISVIITPYDPRRQPLRVTGKHQPVWLAGLYTQIESVLKQKAMR